MMEMNKAASYPRPKKKVDRATKITIGVIIAIYALAFGLEQVIPASSMLFTVLKKGATYALVAVSMNLLNGFTGLFSLGQAGFMLVVIRILYQRSVNLIRYESQRR